MSRSADALDDPTLRCDGDPLALAAAAAEAASSPLAIVETSGRLLWANRAFVRQSESTGTRPAEIASAVALRSGDDPEADWLRAAGPDVDGRPTWLIEGRAGMATEAAATVALDPLTGVLTREAILRDLHCRWERRGASGFAVIFVDLDDFKQINDRKGHVVGDSCLAIVGQRLADAVRGDDAVGRYGGDEFLVLVANAASHDQCDAITRRLRAAISQPLPPPAEGFEVRASMGVALSSESAASPVRLIEFADRSMYAEKRRAGG